MTATGKTLCPSAPHNSANAQVFAVVGGTVENPAAAYLERPLPMSDELVRMASPAAPEEVFRIASPCMGGACGHFDGGKKQCRLATKTVRLQPAVTATPPPCAIRSSCRWWQQEGVSACLRCPQVVTTNFAPSETARAAADVENVP